MSTKAARNSNQIRRVFAIILMIIALFGSLSFLQKFLCIPYGYDQNRAIMLHKEPANSIDVLLIGSSATYSGFSSVYAYEQFGFTSFPYAIGGSTCTSWKAAVQDALQKQSPQLIVIDVFGGGYDLELIESRNNQLYTILSHTPLSEEKVSTAKQLSEDVSGTSIASLLFPILKYHSSVPSNFRSAIDSIRAYHSGTSKLKGVEIITRKRKLAQVDASSFSDEVVPLDEKTERIILDFMDYCKSKNLKLLFVKYPTVLTANDPDELKVNLKANRILEIARESGFATLNMQKSFHDIGLNEQEDFYNHGHTNTCGQLKVSKFLGEYILANTEIAPSILSESNKKAWDDCIPYYNAYCELAEELMRRKIYVSLGDNPSTTEAIGRILEGESIESIANEYFSD